MKKLFGLLFIACASFGATAAKAQTMLKVDVPFDFVVRGDTLPASSYAISKLSDNDSSGLAFVRDGARIQTRATSVDSQMSGSRLEFLKIGDTYFLSNVVTPSGTLHFPLPRKAARIVAGTDGKSLTSIGAE